jgi:hypothetical protein
LNVGDRVVTCRVHRDKKTVQEGQAGTIKAIRTNATDGSSLYLVTLDSQAELYFIRAELRKRRDGE